MTDILRKPLQNEKTVDYRFTCTQDAGRRVYGNALTDAGKVRVIPNAIDIERFAFQPQTRQKLRKELHLEDAIVIGHAFLDGTEALDKPMSSLEYLQMNQMIQNGQLPCKYPMESTYPVNNWQVRRMLLDMDTYLPGDILCKMDRASMTRLSFGMQEN